MQPIKVALLGIGTVGRGTFEVLARNQEEIRRRAGRGIEIAVVADLDTARAPSSPATQQRRKWRVVGARQVPRAVDGDIQVPVEMFD